MAAGELGLGSGEGFGLGGRTDGIGSGLGLAGVGVVGVGVGCEPWQSALVPCRNSSCELSGWPGQPFPSTIPGGLEYQSW